jgi:integrase
VARLFAGRTPHELIRRLHTQPPSDRLPPGYDAADVLFRIDSQSPTQFNIRNYSITDADAQTLTKDQQAQMRHSNAETTMNVYTQTLSDSLRAAMNEFDEKMSRHEHKSSKDSEHK